MERIDSRNVVLTDAERDVHQQFEDALDTGMGIAEATMHVQTLGGWTIKPSRMGLSDAFWEFVTTVPMSPVNAGDTVTYHDARTPELDGGAFRVVFTSAPEPDGRQNIRIEAVGNPNLWVRCLRSDVTLHLPECECDICEV